MQKFQQLIFQALSKTDDTTPEMRQKVYEQVWLTQERSLVEHDRSDREKNQKRQQLTKVLKEIEGQYRAGKRPPYDAHPAPSVEPVERNDAFNAQYSASKDTSRPPHQPAYQQDPELSKKESQERFSARHEYSDNSKSTAQQYSKAHIGATTTEPHQGMHNSSQYSNSATGENSTQRQQDKSLYYLEKEVNKKPKNKSEGPSFFQRIKLSTYFITILTLIVIMFVAWSFYNSFGLSGISEKHQAMSHSLMQQNNYTQEGWIEVFDPANANGLTTKGTATADLHHEVDTNFIRLTTNQKNDAGVIEVGQGALMPLRGKTATFKLVSRNRGEDIGHLELKAQIGEQTKARYDFELPPTTTPLLFRLDVPQNLNEPVKVYLNGGDTKKSQIDIFALLVRKPDETGQ